MSDLRELSEIVDRERTAALERVASATAVADLEDAETMALGRKAPMSALKRELGGLAEEDRRTLGRLLNQAREAIEAAIAGRREMLAAREEQVALAADRVDVTLPGRPHEPGHPHPSALVIERITDVFVGMGYRVAEGPEVETDWYAFDALNMPPDHPARSGFDTMFIDGHDALLRPQT